MLTFKSNQPGLTKREINTLGEIATNEETQVVADDLSQKRSVLGSFKNPEKFKVPNQQLWDTKRINQCPPKMIKQLIQEKTLKADQTACQNILKKIVDEKGNEELEKIWYLANREEIRTKLSQRHEMNIQREIDSGIKKNYVHVSALVKKQNKLQNNKTERLIQTRDIFKKDETIYSINCKNQNIS